MKSSRLKAALALCLLLAPTLSQAANAVLSDVFDGSENRVNPLPGTCNEAAEPLGYQDTGTFQVAAGGDYLVVDAFNFQGVDVTALIYQGAFDPANPQNNLLTPNGIDFSDVVTLAAGVDYRLVVQHWCQNREGAWAVTFSGPGNVTSGVARSVPAMTQGAFSNSDPIAATDCNPSGFYQQSGPMQVQASGRYYYTDILVETEVDVCLQVYTEPFNPDRPDDNRVGEALDDFGSVELQAGTDYWFVAQPLDLSLTQTGEYFYVLAPPAPFSINKALAGGWFNPETNGQGFFIDVFESRNEMFVGWYTFDLSRPVDGTAELGEPGHRWLTGYGAIAGDEGALDVFLARGGACDATSPWKRSQ